jgi:hypothetical protein
VDEDCLLIRCLLPSHQWYVTFAFVPHPKNPNIIKIASLFLTLDDVTDSALESRAPKQVVDFNIRVGVLAITQ